MGGSAAACRRTRARPSPRSCRARAARTRAARRRALAHDQRRRNLQVGERLSTRGQRVARRLRASGDVARNCAASSSACAVVRSAAAAPAPPRASARDPTPSSGSLRRRSPTGGSGRCPGRSCRRDDRSGPAVACRMQAPNGRRGSQHRVSRQALGVAHRVDRPGAALPRVGGRLVIEQIGRVERRGRVVHLHGLEGDRRRPRSQPRQVRRRRAGR